MSDVQVWTLIGVFAASMFGVIDIVTTSFTRAMKAGFEVTGYRIETFESRVGAKIDLLDRDISLIARRVFPKEPT